jgi:hypothetical protein
MKWLKARVAYCPHCNRKTSQTAAEDGGWWVCVRCLNFIGRA